MRCAARRGATPAAPAPSRRPHGWARGRRPRRATGPAQALRRARYALWKNPENLTDRQTAKLAWIAKTDPRLYRAYLLKEGLRTVFELNADQAGKHSTAGSPGPDAAASPHSSPSNGASSGTAPILAAIDHGLSNGLIESINTKIRLLTRIAFGFAHPDALIALAMLALGGHRPALPGRTKHPRISQ